jgi:hypothetical protein
LLLPAQEQSSAHWNELDMAEQRGKTNRRRFTVDALFTDTSARGVGVEILSEARLIRLERIAPDLDQPRRTFDSERLEELAASIRAEGVLQPIAVRYDEQRDIYVVLHGERAARGANGGTHRFLRSYATPVERRLLQQLMENVVAKTSMPRSRSGPAALKEQWETLLGLRLKPSGFEEAGFPVKELRLLRRSGGIARSC